MKNLSKILLIAFAFMFSSTAFSAIVDENTAKTVAINFLNRESRSLLKSEISLVYTKENTLYIYGNESLFVIVSANDIAYPVLGYSNEGSFNPPMDSIGNNFFGLMKSYDAEINYAIENNILASAEIENQWQSLLSGEIVNRNDKGVTTVVTPLMTTTWGQGWPYNADCPVDASGPGGHVWTGCVATALAQVIHYTLDTESAFEGLGSYSYTWGSYPETSVDFGSTTYDMVSMPNAVSDISDPGATEIAKLSYHVAVGCRSMWGAGSTGVSWTTNDNPMVALLQNYLPLAASAEVVWKEDYTDTDWHTLIQAELTAGRVVYYRGDGVGSHAFVCDGVDASDFYHFNFGWDGSNNGYFALSAITPGGYDFTNNQAAIVGIKPNDGSVLTANTTWSSSMTVNTNLVVPDAVTLTVNPGVTISFAEDCNMRVWGRVLSTGTANSYAKFTAINPTDGWGGIDYKEDYMDRMLDNDSSIFVYTQIEYSQSSGLYCDGVQKLRIENCKINNNFHDVNGGGAYFFDSFVTISNSDIFDNTSSFGGGLYIYSSEGVLVLVRGNDIYDNIATSSGGGVYSTYGDNIFEENNLYGNFAIVGAAVKITGSSPEFINCKFLNNETPSPGFGCIHIENSTPIVVGCLIANNDANGIFIKNSVLDIINSTIVNNNHDFGSGMVFDESGMANAQNCIVYGNVANNPSYGNQITMWNDNCNPNFEYCDIQGGVAGFGGPGAGTNYSGNYINNIDSDPLFVNPTAGAGIAYDASLADFSCQSSSPCVDAGDLTGVAAMLPALDLAGNPRIVDVIDMGAYELYCTAPSQPSEIAGEVNPCENSTEIYSVIDVTGVDYTWGVPSDWTIVSGQGTHAITVTVGSLDGDILVTPSNGCGNGPDRVLAVMVNFVPSQPSEITGEVNPCENSTKTYSVIDVTGVSYAWGVPGDWTIVSGQGTHAITVTVGSLDGDVLVTPSNGCGNGPDRVLAVIVNFVPSQPSEIAGNTDPCENSTEIYSVIDVTGVDYTWGVPSTWTIVSGQGTNEITVTVGSLDGDVLVTPSNGCGNGPDRVLAVTVNFVPSQPSEIAGEINPFAGDTEIYSVIDVVGVNYTWIVPTGWSIQVGQGTNEITVIVGTIGGEISVTPDNGCGSGPVRTLVVTVGDDPFVVASADPVEVCNGEDSQLSAEAYNFVGSVTYSWTNGLGEVISNEQSFQIFPTETDTYTVEATDGNEIVTDNVTVIVNQLVPAAGNISGNSQVCEGATETYSIDVLENANGYLWSVTSGFSIVNGQNTTSIEVSFDGTSVDGEISVYGMGVCGNGEPSSLSVEVELLPEIPNQPFGPTVVNSNQVVSSDYTTDEVGGALAYEWILNPVESGELIPSGNSASVVWNIEYFGYCYLSVSATNNCGQGEYSSELEIYVDYIEGVRETDLSTISLYPNPTNGIVYFGSLSNDIVVEIHSISGQLIKTVDTNSFNFSAYEKGVYFVKFISQNGMTEVRKVIKH